MGRAGLVVATVLLGACAASAEVMVRVSGDRVDLRATAAPLADVLDRLARQTGMAIIYEAPRPRQLVTVAFDGRSPAEAVLGLLEGQGLNYALVADPTGRRVATLVLSGAAGTGTLTANAPTPPFARPRRPFPMFPGAGPDATNSRFTRPEPEPVEDAPLLTDEGAAEDEPGDDDSQADSEAETPAPPAGLGSSPTVTPAADGSVPAAPMPAPGSQGQVYPVSPFTPQPKPVLPPAPPGTPAATPAQAAPGTNDTTSP